MTRRDIGTDDPRVRVRPGKGTRPRTKKRPSFEDAIPGLVTAVDRGRFTVAIKGQTASVQAVKARALGRKGIIVGDRVGLEGDTSGTPDTLARIVTLQERTTVLRRSFDESETGTKEKLIVANATQMLIVVAAANPEPKTGMIDRAMVTALDAGVKPLLVITKTDLDAGEGLTREYEKLLPVYLLRREDYDATPSSTVPTGVPATTTTSPDPSPLVALKAALEDEVTVLLGHSGVGKSTLINALVPSAQRVTGQVNTVTGKGRHTSSSAVAFSYRGGWVIDTPGVRSFGLAHIDADGLLAGFTELATIAKDCPRGCTHREDAPDCLLDSHPECRARVASFRHLLAEIPKPY